MIYIVLYTAFFAALAIATLRHPALGFTATMVVFGIEQAAQGLHPFFVSHDRLTNYACALIAGEALVVSLFRGGGLDSLKSRISQLVCVLLAYATASVLWSVAPTWTISRMQQSAPYVIALGLLAPLVVKSIKDLRTALLGIGGVATGIALLAAFVLDWSGRGIRLQVEGTANLAIDVASNALAISQLAGYMLIIVLMLRTNTNPLGLPKAVSLAMRICLSLVAIYVIVQSGSRGQLLGVLVAIPLFFLLNLGTLRLRTIGQLLVGMGAMAALIYFAVIQIGMSERWNIQNAIEVYQATRIETSMQLLGHWVDAGPFYWLFGLGSSASFAPDLLGFYPHNVPIEILCELGLIGFALFCCAVGMAFWSLIRAMLRLENDPVSRSALACLGSMLVYDLLLSLKQGALLGATSLIAMLIVVGGVTRSVHAALDHWERTNSAHFSRGSPSVSATPTPRIA